MSLLACRVSSFSGQIHLAAADQGMELIPGQD